MPQTCTVCRHPERASIDGSLCVGIASVRRLAAAHGLTEAALRRHKEGHLVRTLALAQKAPEAAQADELLRTMRALQSKTLSILLAAEKEGDLRTALAAIGQARANVELLGRLAGELENSPQIVVVLAEVIELVKTHVPDFATRRILAEELARVLDSAAPR
jgi:hypothetical protein